MSNKKTLKPTSLYVYYVYDVYTSKCCIYSSMKKAKEYAIKVLKEDTKSNEHIDEDFGIDCRFEITKHKVK